MKNLILAGAIAFALAGCGSSPNQTAPNVVSLASNTLQFAAGTANLYGLATGLNVVATYRQPNGNSGTLVNTPTITLPAAIPAGLSAGSGPAGYDASSTVLLGPAAGETTAITATSQAPLSCGLTSFGQSGGVFGLGIEPYNATGQGDCSPAATNATGTPFQVAPYAVPLYDSASPTYAAGADPNAFIPWGGPPAFSLAGSTTSVVGSSNYPAGTAGVGEGIDVFAGIAPVAGGHYTLGLSIPTTTNGTSTPSATFTMPAALKTLGNAVAPAFVGDVAGDGGGTLAFVMPALATEAYVQVTDYGPAAGTSCNGSSAGSPVYYTLETTASGTLTLPALLGPGATPSVCTAALNAGTADQVGVQVIAFDYDIFHASYPASLGVAAPAQILAQTSDDITISPAICVAGGVSCTASLPLLTKRAIAAAALRR